MKREKCPYAMLHSPACFFVVVCLLVILFVCLLKCRSLSQGACSFHLGLIPIYLA